MSAFIINFYQSCRKRWKKLPEFYQGFGGGAIAIIVILVVMVSVPLLFVRLGVNAGLGSDTGPVGDTIGGVLGPLVAMVAAILTYMAFYIQYEANQQQKTDLQKERFENKFFEMLALHKANVEEMRVSEKEMVTTTTQSTTQEGNTTWSESKQPMETETIGRELFVNAYEELLFCFKWCKIYLQAQNIPDQDYYLLKLSYRIIYNGLQEARITHVDPNLADDQLYIKTCIDSFKKELRTHEVYIKAPNRQYLVDESIFRGRTLPYFPFQGHSTRFGHYYRHLFLLVKYVVNHQEDWLDETQKRDYLRLLRAQLSDYEQLMLYYNHLSGYGWAWENTENHFFTDYRMIHNMWLERSQQILDARQHFQTQIQHIRDTTGEEMFEHDE